MLRGCLVDAEKLHVAYPQYINLMAESYTTGGQYTHCQNTVICK